MFFSLDVPLELVTALRSRLADSYKKRDDDYKHSSNRETNSRSFGWIEFDFRFSVKGI
jgi:hypothetical protein